jgi:uncharacterized protein (TIGR00645 family)
MTCLSELDIARRAGPRHRGWGYRPAVKPVQGRGASKEGPVDDARVPTRRASRAERLIERTIFGSRWLLAPFYLGLIFGLVALLAKFALRVVDLLGHLLSGGGNEITIGILSLIDLSLMANLLLMVIFAGYESFISRLDVGEGGVRLDWMGQVGFGDLKLKLLASIVAISAIHVLEGFLGAEHESDRTLAWLVGIHMAFVVSAVLLALMDRLSGRGH